MRERIDNIENIIINYYLCNSHRNRFCKYCSYNKEENCKDYLFGDVLGLLHDYLSIIGIVEKEDTSDITDKIFDIRNSIYEDKKGKNKND